jgi:hypothetical protein
VSLRDAGVANWEALFVQFRDPDSGTCAFLPSFLFFLVLFSTLFNNISFNTIPRPIPSYRRPPPSRVRPFRRRRRRGHSAI